MNCVFFTLISLGEIVLSIVQELQEEKKKIYTDPDSITDGHKFV